MTTVADLVAKLGFEVDTTGFDNFKNALDSFQSMVRSSLSGLKEYAKQAEKISNAFKKTYLPTRKEAKERYVAETEAIRAKTYAQFMRASFLPKALEIRDRNATSREKQIKLKERREESGDFSSKQFGLLAAIHKLSGSDGLLGQLMGTIGGFVGRIAGPIGKIIGDTVGRIVGNTLTKVGGFIINQIRQAAKYMMSFVDYRRFTGRSVTGLSGLMGMTKHTADLTPQDVLKDAQRMGQEYWDLWFGGGNPRFWQLLSLRPTMNGEQNIKNVLDRVYKMSGGMKTPQGRGLALKLLREGQMEQYMPILEKWSEYKESGEYDSLFDFSEEQLRIMEETNRALREFGQTLDNVRAYFVSSLMESGLKESLQSIAHYIMGLVLAFKSGKIHDKSSFIRHIFDFERMEASGAAGVYVPRSTWEEQLKEKKREKKEEIRSSVPFFKRGTRYENELLKQAEKDAPKELIRDLSNKYRKQKENGKYDKSKDIYKQYIEDVIQTNIPNQPTIIDSMQYVNDMLPDSSLLKGSMVGTGVGAVLSAFYYIKHAIGGFFDKIGFIKNDVDNLFSKNIGSSQNISNTVLDKAIDMASPKIQNTSNYSGTTVNNFNNNIDMSNRSVEEGSKFTADLNEQQFGKVNLNSAVMSNY